MAVSAVISLICLVLLIPLIPFLLIREAKRDAQRTCTLHVWQREGVRFHCKVCGKKIPEPRVFLIPPP
jgi:hypothetical protein